MSFAAIIIIAMTNIPDFLDPSNPTSETFFGTRPDGSIAVTVQLVFTVPDEQGLRAAHLKDPDHGDVAPDWGAEAAAVAAVSEVLRAADWAAAGLRASEARVRSGGTLAVVPGFTSNM